MTSARKIGWAVLALGLVVGSACGKEAKVSSVATKTVSASESAYCRLTIKREAAQIRQNMHPFKPNSPELLQSELDYNEYAKQGLKVAPPAIRAAFHTFATWRLNVFSPLAKKYGYDEGRFGREANGAEKKLIQQPPDVEKAFGQIVSYEHDVCAIGDPEPADVKFTGSSKSAYCGLVQKDQAANDKWWKSKFDTSANRAYLTSHVASWQAQDVAASQDQSLPSAVRDGIHKVAVNARTKGMPALTKYNFDIARLIENGTTAERRAFTLTGPDLKGAAGSVFAYNDQVCLKG